MQIQAPERVFGHSAVTEAISASIGSSKGVFLLTGPPGCGKNQIIKYYALNNIKIPVSSASEVIGPYVGQSEKQLIKIFD